MGLTVQERACLTQHMKACPLPTHELADTGGLWPHLCWLLGE